MLRRAVFFSLVMIAVGVGSVEIYRARDAEGNLIFSDTPIKGGEKIELRDIDTVPALPTVKRTTVPSSKAQNPSYYTEILVTAPIKDSSFYSDRGDVSITVRVAPSLRRSDTLVYYLDEKEIARGAMRQHKAIHVERGTHHVRIAVVDRKNKEVRRSETIEFTLLKHSLQSPPRQHREAAQKAQQQKAQ